MTDDHIATVEQFMRQQALNQAAIKLSESYDSNCEALLDDDDLVQIFGKKYANCPEEFEFLPGEREFIKKNSGTCEKTC